MSGYLLDTNVISEMTRARPDPGVVGFLDGEDDLWLSAIVLHELALGVELLPAGEPGDRRDSLMAALERLLAGFQDRVLAVEREVARAAARLRARARRSGRVLHLADGLIAGTAMAHGLALVTRNERDFAGLDLQVTNPWQRR